MFINHNIKKAYVYIYNMVSTEFIVLMTVLILMLSITCVICIKAYCLCYSIKNHEYYRDIESLSDSSNEHNIK